jgi:hypothetical protein
MLSGDIVCCKDPPATCPRRYCSLAFRSFEKNMGVPELEKKKSAKTKRK